MVSEAREKYYRLAFPSKKKNHACRQFATAINCITVLYI